jgi:hypothetical protein
MPPTLLPSVSSSLLGVARRIDAGKLTIQGLDVRGGRFLDRTHSSERAHGRTEQRDAGEKEQCFLFGGSWHGATLIRAARSNGTDFAREGPFCGAQSD